MPKNLGENERSKLLKFWSQTGSERLATLESKWCEIMVKFEVKRTPKSFQKLGQSGMSKVDEVGSKLLSKVAPGGTTSLVSEIHELVPRITASKIVIFRTRAELDRKYRGPGSTASFGRKYRSKKKLRGI
jgi:hypothetical protein